MGKLVTPHGVFTLNQYETEKEFEHAVVSQVRCIFGENRVYLDCKRRIGAKGGKQNIPDAFLIDLSSPRDPRLYVVENELSKHDPFDHIGVQLLQFSVSYAQSGRLVKALLFEELSRAKDAKSTCDKYVRDCGYRNLDHFLDVLVFDGKFRALVIIDEATEDLYTVLKNLGFPVEVVEFRTYINGNGERIFAFEPFLEDVEPAAGEALPAAPRRSISDLDTVVVPARAGGFERVFLGENRWWAVRIHPTMQSQLKYIAAYRVVPYQAITHYAHIRSIEPWQDSGKVVVNFAEHAKEIGPLRLVEKGKVAPLFGLRYTTYERLVSAKNLDDVFAPPEKA